MKSKIKRTIAILLAVCFLVSITAAAASAYKEKTFVKKEKIVNIKETAVVKTETEFGEEKEKEFGEEKEFIDDEGNEKKFNFIGSDMFLGIVKFVYQMFHHSFSP